MSLEKRKNVVVIFIFTSHLFIREYSSKYRLVNKFNITSVPTFIFLKKGEKVYEIIGTDEKQFAFFIQELYYFR